jgi:crossover junction endodeoxyribonuclease RuvC
MKILSIDPGFDRLGVAVIEKKSGMENLVYSDCFTTDKELSYPERINLVSEEIERLVAKYSPSAFASESLFFANNQRTAIDVAGVRGVILSAVERSKIPIFEYTPLQIKIAVTGYGKSTKRQVMDMIPRLIKMDKKKALDDEYDAIAVGLTCLASEKI